MKKCRICGVSYKWWDEHLCSGGKFCVNCNLAKPCECDDDEA